jgi:hypothetical protein
VSNYNKRIPHLLKSDPKWRETRAAVLKEEPMCRECARLGYATAATTVDHIIPRSRGGKKGRENLQPLCNECHGRKSGREKHGHIDDRPAISVDGTRNQRIVTIAEKDFGTSPRARFLNRSRDGG